MIKDYYTILGIHKDSSADEIHQAYGKLSTSHPNHLTFEDLEEAYTVLKHEGSRLEYDLRLKYTAQHREPQLKQKKKASRRRVTQSNYNSWRMAITFFKYMCWISFAFFVLICVDYVLPTSPQADYIEEKDYSSYYGHLMKLTTSNESTFEVPKKFWNKLQRYQPVTIYKSMIFRSSISVSLPKLSDQQYEATSNIYGPKFMIAIILGICSFAGCLPRLSPNNAINFGVSSTMLLPIVFFLI